MTRDEPAREFDIRPWVLCVSVFLALMVCCSQAAAQESFALPCGVPYECVTDQRVANATATWKMSFDSRYTGIYDIVHWEIAYTTRPKVEYLAQLVRPQEGRLHYRFFVRERHGSWYTLWLKKHWVWRQVRQPSPEHEAMTVRLRVLYYIAQMLRDGRDPASLSF